jgi:TldD protein
MDRDGQAERELCGSLLGELQRRWQRDWRSATAAVDVGATIKGRFVDSQIDDLTLHTSRHSAVRAVTDTGLAFSADTRPTSDLVGRLPGVVNGRMPPAAGPAGPVRPGTTGFSVLADSFPISDVQQWLRRADESARSYDPRVQQLIAEFDVVRRDIWIGSCGGDVLRDDRSLAYIVLRVIARQNGKVATGFYTPGVKGSIDNLDPVDAGREVAQRAVAGLQARPAPTGRFPVVIGGGRGIVLLHEACCHPLEGDEVLRRSVYSGQLGRVVAADGVTIVDDPTIPDAVGSYEIDDEGVRAERTVLVDDGALAGYLTDRETSHRLGLSSSGNGRCNSALHPPLPRMSNTCLMAGASDPADIIAATELGIYAEHVGGGEVVEVTGQFVFRVTNGYLIEDGRIGDPISETTISGTGTEVLRGIDFVGNDSKVGAARCGKFGQWVPVGVVGPTLRVSSLLVGGTRS